MMYPITELTAARQQRRDRDRELRRQDFLRAAEVVFARRGYHEAGMEEIAEEAGYAIGTVYRYFNSKKELYQTLLEEKATESHKRLRPLLESGGTARARLRLLVDDEMDFVHRHAEFLRVLVAEAMCNQSDLNEGCRRLREEHRKNFQRVIAEGVRTGEFRAVDEEMTAVLFARFVETFFFEMLGAVPAGEEFTRKLAKVEAFFRETIDLLLLPPQ
jgi:AcrR family transcriptional regulator